MGNYPTSLFINTNNTIYVVNAEKNRTLVWDVDSNIMTNIIYGTFKNPWSLFVTSNGDIYIDDGDEKRRVQKWVAENETFVTVMNIDSSCQGLFVDTNDTIYCSISSKHQVVKKSMNDPKMTSNIVAAGTDCRGSDLISLDEPRGIFVDVNFDLYVADCGNNRIQLFQSGESTGITVAGDRSPNPTISLSCPSGIVLDTEKYLFILDRDNHRIVGSSSNGFRCLIGCYGPGFKSNQLFYPGSFSFDRYGNIFVADWANHRIQKFQYLKSCSRKLIKILLASFVLRIRFSQMIFFRLRRNRFLLYFLLNSRDFVILKIQVPLV